MDFVNKRILGPKIVILFDKFKDIGYFWQNRTNWSDKLAYRFSELELENIFYFEIDIDTVKTEYDHCIRTIGFWQENLKLILQSVGPSTFHRKTVHFNP